MRYVLVISTAAAIIALVIVFAVAV
jgi:hypothetical protein